jgi:hypothetical protein
VPGGRVLNPQSYHSAFRISSTRHEDTLAEDDFLPRSLPWQPEKFTMESCISKGEAAGRKGADSVRIWWTDIARLSPEILIASPCGFGVEEAVEQAKQLLQQPGWNDLPAFLNDRVFAVNANAYFARPGPRVVDGVELLAHLIHSKGFKGSSKRSARRQLRGSRAGARERWLGTLTFLRQPSTAFFGRTNYSLIGCGPLPLVRILNLERSCWR